MELNQLPEGYDAEKHGPQKRETEFESQKAKLASDAENLIVKARKSLQETGINNASNDLLVAAIKIIVGSHRKDFNRAVPDAEQTLQGTAQTLGAAVTSNLYTEEKQALLAQARSREGVRAQYETFIDEAQLTEVDALKLKEMMSEANYVLAVETAKESKASKIPTYEQIVAELMTFTPDRLRDICEMMEKPEIVIESDQSFAENVRAMNDNKHYTAKDDNPQEDTYVNAASDSPYRNLNKPGKVKAGIVDGVPHPEEPEGISAKLGAKRAHYEAKFAAKKMRQIGPKGSAALLQQSMKRAKAAGDNSLIVDNWERWANERIPGTTTLLDPSELTESALVAYSVFYSFLRQANFGASFPDVGGEYARGRASVQVLEI